jgi:hypothetical protein
VKLLASIGRAPRSDPAQDELRNARVAVTRRLWEEIPEARLVARGFGQLVDAESDAVFIRAPGVIFERGSARLIDERKELAFYVDSDGWPVVLERQPETWSDITYRRARAVS